MIPLTVCNLEIGIPSDHKCWMPKKDDLSEDGFGCFRSTWLIRDVTIAKAKEISAAEQARASVATDGHQLGAAERGFGVLKKSLSEHLH
jgi:hypothetical protein